jgi:PII-like signaling protein
VLVGQPVRDDVSVGHLRHQRERIVSSGDPRHPRGRQSHALEFETHALFDDGSWLTATTNMFASLFVGLLAVRAGAAASLTARDIIATVPISPATGVRTMKVPENGVLLRIFIGESDEEPGRDRPLYEAIVRRARAAHLAGATVLRGPMGFGRHSRVHTAKLLELSTDLPILIEIVDSEEKVDAFLPTVDELVTEGLVTLEAVRIVRYVSPDSR